MLVYICMSLACHLRGTISNKTLVATSTASPRPWFALLLPKKKRKYTWEKWLILELGQEIYKMNLEHLAVTENENMLKTIKDPQ